MFTEEKEYPPQAVKLRVEVLGAGPHDGSMLLRDDAVSWAQSEDGSLAVLCAHDENPRVRIQHTFAAGQWSRIIAKTTYDRDLS